MTPSGPRRILIRLNRRRLWRWTHVLAERLGAGPGTVVRVDLIDGPPLPRAAALLLSLERLVLRLPLEHAADLLDPAAFDAWRGDVRRGGIGHGDVGEPGLVLDLSGGDGPAGSTGLRVLYDGAASEDAAIAAVLDGRSPRLAVATLDGRRPVAVAWPAVEDPHVLTRALDTIFAALVRLCVKASQQPATVLDRPAGTDAGREGPPPAAVGFAIRMVADRLASRLTRLSRRQSRWFVAWRPFEPAGDPLALGAPGEYRALADDGARYFADPFPLTVDGRTALLVEEFPYATGRGIISAADRTPDGFGPFRPVLEASVHLSYPMVFASDGEVWMIPETMQSRSVELYRAVSWPDRWSHEATLLRDVWLSDATVFRHDGLWWMFAATRDWLGSNWDTLGVFYARSLPGPWQAHPANPILIDAGQARPAGRVFASGGALWRPAQCCDEAYGAGLTLCRIDLLNRDVVRQSEHRVVRMRDRRVTRGPHTLNREGSLEVIDLYGRPDDFATS